MHSDKTMNAVTVPRRDGVAMTAAGEDFVARLEACATDTERLLDHLLAQKPEASEVERPPRLLDAMRYATLGGGKRLRPFLVVESANLFAVAPEQALMTGAALECIHCYSLVHDDLPAMDNDDLRRGRPTAHKAYDEATAILAGDSLLTFAFDILSRPQTHPDPEIRVALVRELARAAGLGGMAGGQLLDLAAEGRFDGGRQPAQGERDIVVAAIDEDRRAAALRLHRRRHSRQGASPPSSRRCRATATRSASPSRSPTICSTSKATRRRSARPPARTRRAARRRWSAFSASPKRASGSQDAWRKRKPRCRRSAKRAKMLSEAARFVAARRN